MRVWFLFRFWVPSTLRYSLNACNCAAAEVLNICPAPFLPQSVSARVPVACAWAYFFLSPKVVGSLLLCLLVDWTFLVLFFLEAQLVISTTLPNKDQQHSQKTHQQNQQCYLGPSFSSTLAPCSSHSCFVIHMLSLSAIILASTAPPKNTM